MKLFLPLVKAAVSSLYSIFVNGEHADMAVEQVLKQDARWGARDRKFIANTVYDVVRWFRLYASCITEQNQQDSAFYYQLIGVSLIVKDVELPAWEEFASLNADEVMKNYQSNKKTRAIGASIPDWIDKIAVEQLGKEKWEQELPFLNQEAQVYLRVNTLKTKPKPLAQLLQKQGVELLNVVNVSTSSKEDLPNALQLSKRQKLNHLQEFKNGFFEIQDIASQLVAPMLQVVPGMRVIDACAGAGGKTLHIAALMQNKGSILALDPEPHKLHELQKRAQRAGARIVETKLSPTPINEHSLALADRILLDVPCSGLGVLKRNPDTKWKLSSTTLENLLSTQKSILSSYAKLLKPQGILVYATCSILPCENENQVAAFIASQNGNYTLLSEKKLWPSNGFDGFYMAAITRVK